MPILPEVQLGTVSLMCHPPNGPQLYLKYLDKRFYVIGRAYGNIAMQARNKLNRLYLKRKAVRDKLYNANIPYFIFFHEV